MKQKTEPGLLKIQGLIIPATWDNEGNILSVAVSTFDEDEYLVDMDRIGEQLLGLLREKVEVSGSVEIKDGNKTITVKEYMVNKRLELMGGASEESYE